MIVPWYFLSRGRWCPQKLTRQQQVCVSFHGNLVDHAFWSKGRLPNLTPPHSLRFKPTGSKLRQLMPEISCAQGILVYLHSPVIFAPKNHEMQACWRAFRGTNIDDLDRAGFSWWEAWGPWWQAWAQWRIWDFRKGLAIELQGFKNWGVWCETPCWWEAWGPPPLNPALDLEWSWTPK